MEAAQCASLKARLERRVNRIPAALRNTTMAELLAPASDPKPEPAYAKPTVTAITKKRVAAAASPPSAPAPAPAARKTRAAPAAKPTTKTAKKPTTTRTKKRGSDEMSTEDKENTGLDVAKKRVRAVAPKPAPAARTTRAASRQKAILSPKNINNAKPTKASARPR